MAASSDVEIKDVGTGGIASLAWSAVNGMQALLASTSWDNSVRIWEVSSQGMATPRAMYTLGGPVLTSSFYTDGSKLFTGGADRSVMVHDLAANKSTGMGQHNHGVKCVRWLPQYNLLASGGWDRRLVYWDPRQPNPALSLDMPERVYAMDAKSNLLTVALGGQEGPTVAVYDLAQPQRPRHSQQTSLKNHARCISLFTDLKGYVVSGIEGRVVVHHMDFPKDSAQTFVFKAHKDASNNAYPINVVEFHPHGTFVTAGADGTYVFWDKAKKSKLSTIQRRPTSISAGGFGLNGNIFAYAVSYDWTRGPADPEINVRPQIFLHAMVQSDFQKN